MFKKVHKTNSGKFAMMRVIKANPLSESSIMYLYFCRAQLKSCHGSCFVYSICYVQKIHKLILNRKPNDKMFDKHESKEAILGFYVMPYNAKCYIL